MGIAGADANFFTGGTKNYITRPTVDGIVTQNNTQDIARKAITLLPTTDIKAINLNTYKAEIDPNAPQGTQINGLQSIDYKHHIRGGLLGINLDGSNNPTPNATEGDLFSFKLDYESEGFYDGNIGKQTWQNVNSSNNFPLGIRSYTFGYDYASRLLSGTYAGLSNENFSLPNISYDKNGNILNLQRKGKNGGSFGDIDNLTYSYNGNRLNAVSDAVSGDHEVDFVPRGGNSYTYYNDGSLKSDENKEITNIIYDTYLSKPIEIQLTGSRWLKMTYDGSGKLIKREFSTGEIWDYLSNLIFKNGQYYQMGTPEGRAIFANGAWQYEFFYTDHLGNARVSFGADGSNLVVNDVTDFDPTGIQLNGLGQLNATENKFKFLNRERITTFNLGVYQLGARMYDPHRMQFWSTDPKVDAGQHAFTPYHYSFNNPIRFSDADGLYPFPSLRELAQKATQYAVKKVVETVTNIVVASAKAVQNEISNIEISPYAKVEAKSTTGARIAAGVKRNAEIDINAGSVVNISYEAEADRNGLKQDFKYANKGGENTLTFGGGGAVVTGGDYEFEMVKKGGKTISTKHEVSAGTEILPLTNAGGSFENIQENNTNTKILRGSVGIGGKIGLSQVVEAEIQIGIKFTKTKNNN